MLSSQRRPGCRPWPEPALAILPAVLLVAVLLAGPATALEPAHLVAGFPRTDLVLETSGGRCLRIEAWLALRDEHRAQGLMYVTSLGEFEGMYFAYAQPGEISMWMKNTFVSLDMLFIREDGTVGSIVARTTPQSTTRIRSGMTVIGVLELNGGFAERWQVEPGNRLRILTAE